MYSRCHGYDLLVNAVESDCVEDGIINELCGMASDNSKLVCCGNQHSGVKIHETKI